MCALATLSSVFADHASDGAVVSFETVKRIHITNEPFTADNGLLTATFKIKRWADIIFCLGVFYSVFYGYTGKTPTIISKRS